MSERDKLIAQAEAYDGIVAYFAQFPKDRLFSAGDIVWKIRDDTSDIRAIAAQQPEAVEHPLDGPKCEHGYPLSAPSCPLCGGRPQASAPADHTARGMQGQTGPIATPYVPTTPAVGVTDLDALVAHEVYVRVASTPQDGSGCFGDFIEIEDAMGNGVSVPNQSGGNGTHLIGPLYSAQAITDLRALIEVKK